VLRQGRRKNRLLNGAEYPHKRGKNYFDSDLNRLTLRGIKMRGPRYKSKHSPDSPTTHLPKTLVREYEVGLILDGGKEEVIRHEENNRKRTVIIP
jgi:hypothetical protein